MSKKRPRLWYLYTLNGHIISFGVGFAYYIRFGSPEPHSNNKLKFPRLVFLLAFFRELGSTNLNQMKKNKLFGLALLAIMSSFTACTNDTEEMLSRESEIKLTSEITPASRVTSLDYQSTQIISGQQVGVTITEAKTEHKNVAWEAGENGTLTNTGSAVYYGNGTATITAYHPYNTEWIGTNHEFSVNTDQSNETNYRNSDLLWATATSTKTENAVPLIFSHKLAKINVTLTSEDIVDLSGATISICGTNINTGFNPSTGDLSVASSTNVSDIKAGVTTTSAKTASAIIVPQTVAGNTQFIKVTHDSKTYYYALPAEGKTFESKHSYSYTLKITEALVEVTATENINNWIDEENTGIANEAEALPQIDGEIFQSKLTTLTNRNSITKIIFKMNSTPESESTEISEGVEAVNDNGVITIHINASSAQITSGKYMFSSLYNLQSIEGFALLETGAMTNMDGMFAECNELTSIDFSNLDTSNVTSMEQVFSTNVKLTSLDLSNFNTSKVTNMCGMFSGLPFTSLDLSNLNTSNVTTMNQMFCYSAMTSLDLSNFDTSKVEDMTYMFSTCTNLNSIKMMGDVSNVTSVTDMFDGVKENGTFYYNEAYDYSKIIAVLPTTWTAIPISE